MPTETIVVLGAVFAMFAFFAVALVYADMTWNKQPARK